MMKCLVITNLGQRRNLEWRSLPSAIFVLVRDAMMDHERRCAPARLDPSRGLWFDRGICALGQQGALG